MSVMLPDNYYLEGAAEGTRTLYEDVPVYRIVAMGVGSMEHPVRKVATFSRKAKKTQIEAVAWLDFESRHAESEAQRLHCLGALRSHFGGGAVEGAIAA